MCTHLALDSLIFYPWIKNPSLFWSVLDFLRPAKFPTASAANKKKEFGL